MKRRTIYLLVLIFGVLIGSILIFKKDKKKSIVELKVSVSYDENKFVVTNNDTIDFTHAFVSIDQYYKLRNINLQAGESYTIWQMEFLHHNGTHFPIKRRPSQFSIWCELNDDVNGFYSKRIK
jgi:hypothetical protein